MQLFVEQVSVKDWLTCGIEAQRPLRTSEAAQRLGIGSGRLQQLVQAGILKPKLVARGLFGRAPEVRLFDPVPVDHY